MHELLYKQYNLETIDKTNDDHEIPRYKYSMIYISSLNNNNYDTTNN